MNRGLAPEARESKEDAERLLREAEVGAEAKASSYPADLGRKLCLS